MRFGLRPWLVFLFATGFLELSFNSMAQTLAQLNAPAEIRGRVLGLFNMSALGLRAFSGITVGLAASFSSIHVSLAASAVAFIGVMGGICPASARRRDRGSPFELIRARACGAARWAIRWTK